MNICSPGFIYENRFSLLKCDKTQLMFLVKCCEAVGTCAAPIQIMSHQMYNTSICILSSSVILTAVCEIARYYFRWCDSILDNVIHFMTACACPFCYLILLPSVNRQWVNEEKHVYSTYISKECEWVLIPGDFFDPFWFTGKKTNHACCSKKEFP